MPKSKVNTVLLEQYFETNSKRAFTFSDLESILLEHAQRWNLPRSMTPQTFVKMLLSKTKLRELRLRSSDYPTLLRYTWGNHASPVSVAVSVKNGAFFSHASAMWIHGLNRDHKNIFINKEQSEKRPNPGQLSQEAIHRAFQSQQRRSRLAYKYRDTTITVLSGKYTGRLEVEVAKAPSGDELHVTSLERTLVDITVRAVHAGGAPAVLEAFRLARNRASVQKLMEFLTKLGYTYPYQQSIGFYLKRAGYSEQDQLLAKTKGLQFDFYLCHGLKDPAFDQDWKIFFPRTLG
jgi:hypothetical protein